MSLKALPTINMADNKWSRKIISSFIVQTLKYLPSLFLRYPRVITGVECNYNSRIIVTRECKIFWWTPSFCFMSGYCIYYSCRETNNKVSLFFPSRCTKRCCFLEITFFICLILHLDCYFNYFFKTQEKISPDEQ